MYSIINDIVFDKLKSHSNGILEVGYPRGNIKVCKKTYNIELRYIFVYLQPNNISELNFEELIHDFMKDIRVEIEGKSLIGQGVKYRFKFRRIEFRGENIITTIDFEESPADKIEEITERFDKMEIEEAR